MVDTYGNFKELAENEVYGVDYQIRTDVKQSKSIAIAIHGGGIEGGTSELALGLAYRLSCTSYLFEGIKSSGNSVLHITSTNFDEPLALELISNSDYCISFHGYGDLTGKHTKIGGADSELKLKAYKSLTEAKFSAEILPGEDPLSGSDPGNIANKTTRGMGLQLELSTDLRKSFFTDFTIIGREGSETEEFYQYIDALLIACRQ
ncbi:replication protein (plasmid) [Priestia filamentosa]|uniref:Replication protein n=1 Tax=Priestia filamentosa TaxID=1402861 RepID=A0A2L1FFK2_9BACI|nr:poly-gamma-glutamate hydrolase family protein [Priestia filamentosa]AVD54520.1 replication protein [Priestia filamentosa]AVD54632.1 replication protein [Priestia filamentosa]AWG44830.1 replication protein [Priestia filamentosa]